MREKMLSIPKVSFVISTRNRCSVLLDTLAQINRCGLEPCEFDIHVVDNASTDDTVAKVRDLYPKVRLLPLEKNLGSVAKNESLLYALGKYIVFLDDDSYPLPGSIARMIRHFEADEKLGALTFTVTLPNGNQECSAYPNVFIGCGVGLRRRALRLVGGLPSDFFMQAEEYDLSLRLLSAGFKVCRADDLHVLHLKTPQARISSRTMRLDVRNNLFLILRRFPKKWVWPYAFDWMQRYWWIAQSKNMGGSYLYGLFDGLLRSIVRPRRDSISEEAFETFAKINEIKQKLQKLRDEHQIKSVLLADLGKNIHAYWRGCRELGIKIIAIADKNLAHPSRRYRGIKLLDPQSACNLKYDAVIISNLSPVHASASHNHWRMTQDKPVFNLFEPESTYRNPIEVTIHIDSLPSASVSKTA